MAPLPDFSTIVGLASGQRNLRPRSDLSEPGWAFWELRNFNMHRVVGLSNGSRPVANAHELEAKIRGAVARNFKRSWWRGLAYGVVAEVAEISLTPDDLKVLVDGRENEKGTLQWVILVTGDPCVALGVHNWIEGYLSPAYRGILQAIADLGYQVTNAKKEKDGLMKFLTAGADVDAALRSFGTKRVAFPEFRDPFIKQD